MYWNHILAGFIRANVHWVFLLVNTFLFLLSLLIIGEIIHEIDQQKSVKNRTFSNKNKKQRTMFFRIDLSRANKTIHSLFRPLFRSAIGEICAGIWRDAGFGEAPEWLVIISCVVILFSYSTGLVLTKSVILSCYLVFLFLIAFYGLIYYRCLKNRKKFGDQLPDVLDQLSDSLKAGFSLIQAMEFVSTNLPEPSKREITAMYRQIELGHSTSEALQSLFERQPIPEVQLLVEGLSLQSQVGGNMISLMEQIATFVRTRVGLENEIHVLTAQGRLSAIIIALLVPVSLGLLSFFPGYTEVLFKTVLGNIILVITGIFELIGALVVYRMIQVEY